MSDLDDAFALLSSYGIPEVCARSVTSGIMVLEQQMNREITGLRSSNERLERELTEAEALLREAEEREMNLRCQICGSVHFVARVADSAGEKP